MEVLSELCVASLTVVGRIDVLVSLTLDRTVSLGLIVSVHVSVVVTVNSRIAFIATQPIQVLPLAESIEVVDGHSTLVLNHLVMVRLA